MLVVAAITIIVVEGGIMLAERYLRRRFEEGKAEGEAAGREAGEEVGRAAGREEIIRLIREKASAGGGSVEMDELMRAIDEAFRK